MCGIAFLYRPGIEPQALDSPMQQALDRMIHRGPDDHGVVGDPGWRMGHRRLSVIDPPGSRQPMTDPSGRYFLSYNGELYNFRELREQLAGQWSFRTRGDVEVVLAGLVIRGESFLHSMEGMAALAFWDRQKNELLLVRDRMGQKPLFYQYDGQRFACASELGALERLSWFSWQEDARSTADYLRYGYCLPGTTFYRNVFEVLPGHYLHWAAGGKLVQAPYWRLSPGSFNGRRAQAGRRLRQAVIQGVQRRLVADVEVGALLSGGMDSSLIVSIVRRHLGQPLKTFTMGFDDPTFDERRHARRMARFCGSEHVDGCVRLVDSAGLVDLVLHHVGQPFADSSLLPTAMVCRMAGARVKVALSGDGGDELFGGYQRYLARVLLRWFTRLPARLRNEAQQLVRAFPEPGVHHSASVLKKAHLFFDMVRSVAGERPYVAPAAFPAEDLRRLAPDLFKMGHPVPGMPESTSSNDLQRMMSADALIYLPQDILTKVDRASMAYSLEVRSPFMDSQVVELAFDLPRNWHIQGWVGKRMLRKAFGDLLPAWVRRRRKHGFGVPVHWWFQRGLGSELIDRIEQTHCVLDRKFVRQMLDAHRSGRRDHGQRLWLIYIYLYWIAHRKAIRFKVP